MGEVINLRRARKDRDKRVREEKADANRIAFGRLKIERELSEAEARLERARLDAHRLEHGDAPSEDFIAHDRAGRRQKTLARDRRPSHQRLAGSGLLGRAEAHRGDGRLLAWRRSLQEWTRSAARRIFPRRCGYMRWSGSRAARRRPPPKCDSRSVLLYTLAESPGARSLPPHLPEDDYHPAPGGLAAKASALARGTRYLDVLNPEQRAAVETLEGPVLVLAGAGTGKTRVLTTRIAHIFSLGLARAWEILAVTFTNKASREMRERVETLVGQGAEAMQWLGTFHAISAKILRRHAELVGLKSNFTILDTDDQIRLLKQVLKAENIDDKRWPARALAHRIDGWKNRGLTPAQVPAGEAHDFADGKGAALYALYQERLKILNAVDFGDLLLEALRLFRDNPDVLADYQRRFKYILVDEYQDTNTAQYLWLRLIAQGRRNICCVGDDDQSVYGWRGAEVENILRFEKDFPGAKTVRLERNYRSTGHILAAASHLIAHNEGRLGKTLFTDGGEGEKPSVTGVWDSEEEARAIGEAIEQLQRRAHDLEEIAILVRASFQMREFEERFITLGLPYRVIGGPRFYERAEIRDALAYLRCVAQPADDLAFERIVNTPKRGLGDATLQMLHEFARRENIPLMQAARILVESERSRRSRARRCVRCSAISSAGGG